MLYDPYIPNCIVTQFPTEEMVAPFAQMPYSLMVETFPGVEGS